MKITFNSVTIGEDHAHQPIQIEQWGALSVEQVEALFRASNPVRLARGNVAGDFVFTAMTKSATRAAAVQHFVTECGRINTKATLLVIDEIAPSTVATMTNAVCRAVQRSEIIGISWWIRYTFGFTTLT